MPTSTAPALVTARAIALALILALVTTAPGFVTQAAGTQSTREKTEKKKDEKKKEKKDKKKDKKNKGHHEEETPAAPAQKKDGHERVTVANDSEAADRLNGEWNIINVHGNQMFSNEGATTDNRAYIEFDFRNGYVYGNTGCSPFNCDLFQKGYSLTFRNFKSKPRRGRGQELDRMATNALRDEAKGFFITRYKGDEYLHLTDQSNNEIMLLRRQDLSALNGPWAVTDINGHNIGVRQFRVVLDINTMRMNALGECNAIFGAIATHSLRSDAIEFEDLSTEGQPCRSLRDETNLLVALERVTRYRIVSRSEVEFLDKHDKKVISLKRIRIPLP